LPRGSTLFRIHRAGLRPWWFSRSGAGRFDLVASKDLGSCYFAERPEGCILEVFRSFTTTIPRLELDSRRLLRIKLSRDVRLADCTAERCRSWGITAEIHSTPRYEETQAWADAFARAGFDGIRYLLRHDPAQRLAGVVLFGPAGSPEDLPDHPGDPIGEEALEEIRRRFGIQIL
jgi:RES domain